MIPPAASGEFVARMEDVLEVYHRPFDERRPLVCVDEVPVQLVGETRLPVPAAPGRPQRYDYEYVRNGTANLFLAFEPLLGWRAVEVTQRRTARDFAEFLRWLVEELHADARKVVLVTDNLNTHTPGCLYEAFAPARARAIAAAGVALHAQAPVVAEHGGGRVGRTGEAVPGPAHRLAGGVGAGGVRLAGGAQRADGRGALAVHDGQGPRQAPSALPVASIVATD